MAPTTQYTYNGDTKVAYETFGDPATGVPLLLIMGLDFQMIWWPDAFCELLVANGYAVARFDNRDTGLSTHFSAPKKENPFKALAGKTTPLYTGADMLDDGLAVMDALGWESAHLMGGSMGAGLAQGMAMLHPDRTRTIVSAMGSPADASPLKTMSYIKMGTMMKFMRLKAGDDPQSQIDMLVDIHRKIASPGYPFPEQWARETAEISQERSPRVPTSTQNQLAAGRATRIPPLTAMTVPALVISGEDDPLIKVKAGRDTAARIPDSKLVTYPGMGHNMPEELWPEIVAQVRALTDTWQGATGA